MSDRKSRFHIAMLVGGMLSVAVAIVALLLLDRPSVDEDASRPRVGVALDEADAGPMSLHAPVARAVDPIALEQATHATDADASAATAGLAGRVVRLADGSALAHASVHAGSAKTSTDDEGAFAFDDVPLDLAGVTLDLGDDAIDLPLPARTGDLRDVLLVADTGWIVSGSVLGETQGLLFDARIGEIGGTVQAVAPDGRFVLRDVRPTSLDERGGGVLGLVAGAAWHASAERTLRVRHDLRVIDGVDVVLAGAGRLEVRLRFDEGAEAWPAAEVAVRFRHDGPSLATLPLRLRAERDGELFTIDGVAPGRYLVEIDPGSRTPTDARSPHDPARSWTPFVEVREGDATRLELRPPAGAVVAGRITDGAGNPLADVRVELQSVLRWSGVATFDGQRVDMLDGLRVKVTSKGGTGETHVVIEPILATTAADGTYRVERLPPGELALRVSHPASQGVPAIERVLELTEGARFEQLDFVLGGGLRVAGRLTDAYGRPLPGSVSLIAPSGAVAIGASDTLEVGEDGRFEYLGLPPGARQLWVNSPGYVTLFESVQAGDPERTYVLEPAPLLNGVVQDAATGDPVREFQVTLMSTSLMTRRTFSTTDGRFSFDTLEDDDYRLSVTATGYEDAVIEVVRPAIGGDPEVLVRMVGTG